MALPPADRPEPRDFLLRFLRTLPLAVHELEDAVARLIASSWDEMIRRRAHHMASALGDASAASGLSHVASVTRAIASLLKLKLEDAFSIQEPLQEKLRELLALLKDLCQDSDESAQA